MTSEINIADYGDDDLVSALHALRRKYYRGGGRTDSNDLLAQMGRIVDEQQRRVWSSGDGPDLARRLAAAESAAAESAAAEPAAAEGKVYATQQDAVDAINAGELRAGDHFQLHGREYKMIDDAWMTEVITRASGTADYRSMSDDELTERRAELWRKYEGTCSDIADIDAVLMNRNQPSYCGCGIQVRHGAHAECSNL